MVHNLIDETGRVYDHLTVIGRGPNQQTKTGPYATWICRCSCGREIVVAGVSLRGGRKKHCGCLSSKGKRQRSYLRTRTAHEYEGEDHDQQS